MKAKNNPFYSACKFGDSTEEKGTINARLTRYAPAHKRSIDMADYIRALGDMQPTPINKAQYKLADNVNKCGRWLVFRDYYTVGENRLIAADFCKKHLLCPLCAIRRGAKYVQAYIPKYNLVMEQNPSFKGVMLTFTIKNGENLMERVNHLRNSLSKLMEQRRSFLRGKKGYAFTEMSKVEGGVYSLELKRGKNSGLWHPHIHMACLVSDDIDQEKLRREWKAITGDSHQVDVRDFYDDLAKSFVEVFKYALKFSDMSLEDTYHAFEKLSHARLVSSFGCLYGVKVPEDLEDGLMDEDLPYIDRFYKYMTFNREYSLMKAISNDGELIHLDNEYEIRERSTWNISPVVECEERETIPPCWTGVSQHEDDTKKEVLGRCKPDSDKKSGRTEAVKGLRFEPRYP